jgi:hypothetical protein
MSTQRYDVLAPRTYKDRDGNDKTSFTKVGVAFPMKDRDGFKVMLEAIPAPQDGVFQLLMMPPRPREDDQPQQRQPSYGDVKGRIGQSVVIDDEIPF